MTHWLPDEARLKTAKPRTGGRARARSNGLAEARSTYRNGAASRRIKACPATKDTKRARARERDYVQIFLSHKSRDHQAAEEIRQVLQAYGGAKLRVFTYEDIERGDDFRDQIARELYESDWFMLLFTGVDDCDWSWCHHEAGTFCGMMYPDADRVVVFYPSTVALPDPLERYQAVRCQEGTPDDVFRFFEDLFGKEPYQGFPPINPFFANHKSASAMREAAARTIIRAVGRLVVEWIEPKEVMTIHVRNKAALLEGHEFPADTCIRRSGALQLFEVGEREFSWQQFQNALEPNFRQRLNQSFWPAVYQACAKSVRSHKLAPTHAVMHSPADGRHYMPILSRLETTGDNSATFHVTFVHVAAGTQAEVRHKSVARVFTALNLAHRFRWEIIDPYRDPHRLQERLGRQAMDSDAVEGGGGLSTVWEAIRLLEVEAENRGVFDVQALPADFRGESQERVRAMFALWGQHRARLQQAASENDAATFSQVLKEIDPINVEFIALASRRLGELVRADARHP